MNTIWNLKGAIRAGIFAVRNCLHIISNRVFSALGQGEIPLERV